MNYPTLEEVMCADKDELERWQKSLPAPQADVEHTIIRRIRRRVWAMTSESIRQTDPAFAQRWNDAMEKLEKVTGRPTSWRM